MPYYRWNTRSTYGAGHTFLLSTRYLTRRIVIEKRTSKRLGKSGVLVHVCRVQSA